jgi:hypothetical protein
MPVLKQYLIVFINELAALQMLVMHHRPRNLFLFFVKGIWIESLQPIIEIFFEDIGPGNWP